MLRDCLNHMQEMGIESECTFDVGEHSEDART